MTRETKPKTVGLDMNRRGILAGLSSLAALPVLPKYLQAGLPREDNNKEITQPPTKPEIRIGADEALREKAGEYTQNMEQQISGIIEYLKVLSEVGDLVENRSGRSLEAFEEKEIYDVFKVSLDEESDVNNWAMYLKEVFDLVEGHDLKKKIASGTLQSAIMNEYYHAHWEKATAKDKEAFKNGMAAMIQMVIDSFNKFSTIPLDTPGVSTPITSLEKMTEEERRVALVYCILYKRKFGKKKA